MHCKPRVLIVDDEAAILSLLCLAFVRGGYDVRTASDGYRAMELCGKESFDAMLSDVHMPGMDGHQLVRRMVAEHPTVCTALMSALDITCGDCPLKGRCVILRKPFNPKDVVAIITRRLANAGISGHDLSSQRSANGR